MRVPQALRSTMMLCNGFHDLYLPILLPSFASIEHVVPVSVDPSKALDPHNMFFTHSYLNSIRGTLEYAELDSCPPDLQFFDLGYSTLRPVESGNSGKSPPPMVWHVPCVSFREQKFYPPAKAKGMIARALLHCGKESKLALAWHHTHAPTPFEKERARVLFKHTGVRHRMFSKTLGF